MTNEERRAALNLARRKALDHANDTEAVNYDDAYEISRSARLAEMWAHVAQAMKDGDPVHDSVDGRPADGSILRTEYGVISR